MPVDFKGTGYRFLNIETKAACNMDCLFCGYKSRQDKTSELPSEVVHRLIDEIDPEVTDCQGLNFSQFNEPLLDKRLFDFMAHAKDRGIRLLMVTNGLLFGSSKILEKTLNTAPDEIKLSVQTLDAANFSHLRGLNMSLERYSAVVYEFLSAARDTHMDVTVDIACNFLNRKKWLLRRVLGFSTGDPNAPLSLDQVSPDLVRFLEGLAAYDSAFRFDPEQLEKYLATLRSDYVSQGFFPLAENIHLKIKKFMYGQRLVEFQPTSQKFNCNHPILGVLACGNVVPCCHMFSPFVSLGNVNENSLSDILVRKKEFIQRLREKNDEKPDVCKRCFGERTKRALLMASIKEKYNVKLGFNPIRID